MGRTRLGGDYREYKEIPKPDNPPISNGFLYARDLGGITTLFFLDSAGTETDLLGGGGGGITSINGDATAAQTLTEQANKILIADDLSGDHAFTLGTDVVTIDKSNVFGDFNQVFKDNRLLINNPADSFAYTFVAAAIGASHNLNLPLLVAADTIAVLALAQAFTNKTIDADLNTITNIESADLKAAAGILTTQLADATNFVLINQANIFGDFDQTFKDNRIVIESPNGLTPTTIANLQQTLARTLSIPILTGNRSIVVTTEASQIALGTEVTGASTDLSDSTNLARNTDNLSFFAATTSLQLLGVISDETGSGLLVFNDTPTLLAPTIASFANAGHNHQDVAGGGQLDSTLALSDTVNIAYLNTTNTYTAGVRQDFLGLLAGAAGLNVGGIAGNPTTQVNGDVWLNTSTNQIFGRINGVDVDLGAGAGGGENNTISSQGGGTFLLTAAVPKSGVDLRVISVSNGDGMNASLATDVLTLAVASTVVQTDQTNTFGDFDEIFRSNRLIIRDSDNTDNISFTTSAEAAPRIITIPVLGGPQTLSFIGLTETLVGKTLTTPTIADFSNATHDHSNAAGGGNLTNSALTSGVFAAITGLGAQSQALNMNGNDIQMGTGEITVTSGAVGDILKHDATGFIRFARGAALQVLRVNAGGTDLEYATLAGGGDMVLADAQTNTGIKTFLDTTMKLRNVANTFNAFFVNTVTVDRIITIPDAAGIMVITGLANQITNTELTAGAFAKITGVGTIASGTWEGTVVVSAFLDADTMHLSVVQIITGAKTFGGVGDVGKLIIAGTTSGTTVLDAEAVASGVLTLPAATDTLMGKATVDVMINKSYDLGGAGNVLTGSVAEFNTALQSETFAYIGVANAWGAVNQNIATTGKWQEAGVNISPIGLHDIYMDGGAFAPIDSGGLVKRTMSTGTNQKGIIVSAFSASADQYAVTKVTVPENYDGGVITVVISWTNDTTGTGNVLWEVAAVNVSDADALDGAGTNFGTGVQLTADAGTTLNLEHKTARSGNITPANTYVAGDTMYIRVGRLGSNGSDTFDQTSDLLGISVRFGIDAAVAA